MSKQTKEYNHAYNSGYYAGERAATKALEQNEDDLASFALAELALILSRKEGYLRCGIGSDGQVYARYKWTVGAYADHYTFGSGVSPSDAIAQVCSRVQEVESGKRRPSPDTGYKRR